MTEWLGNPAPGHLSAAERTMDEEYGLDKPVLPYAGTSGHSGSDTSRERAEREDGDGTTTVRQQRTLNLLTWAGSEGLTVKDLRERTNWHHGRASAVLSDLHLGGRIARLAERRDRCEVYVLPMYVQGRETKQHQRNKPHPDTEKVDAIRRVIGNLHYGEPGHIIEMGDIDSAVAVIKSIVDGDNE